MYDENEIKTNFGKALKEVRCYRKFTVDALAERIGLQPNSLSQIESGRNFITSETLSMLCSNLNIAPSFFFMKQPTMITDEHADFIKEIEYILPTLSEENLKLLYKFIISIQK